MAGYIIDDTFEIDDVDQASTEPIETIPDRKQVPDGTWNVQVQELLSKVYFDKKDENENQVKRLIPLEVIDSGEFNGQWVWLSVYREPEDSGDPGYDGQVFKFRKSKKRLSMVAGACGLKSLRDLNSMEGKYLRIVLSSGSNGFQNITDASPMRPTTTTRQEPVAAAEPTPVRDANPF